MTDEHRELVKQEGVDAVVGAGHTYADELDDIEQAQLFDEFSDILMHMFILQRDHISELEERIEGLEDG